MSTWTRADHLARLIADPNFDVVVIGGGVIGCGTALDLAARGLSVVVLERSDLAQGTSSRSTKLFHGGIRYLPQFHLELISEGLREQKILAEIADYLYQPLEFVIPLFDQYGIADAPRWAAQGRMAPIALRAGLLTYDLLGGWGRPGRRHRRVTRDQVTDWMPLVKPDGLRGGFTYSDAQTDDARLVVTLAKTAVGHFETTVVTKVEVTAVSPHAGGFRIGATDRVTGESLRIRARAVVSATGAFDPPGPDGVPSLRLVRSKGTHLITPGPVTGIGERALVLPTTDDGRVMFVIPWMGHSLIGTTDTVFSGDPTHPRPLPDEVEFIVRHLRRYLDVPDFEPISAFAGLRALKMEEGGPTASASREHVIEQPVPGHVRVAGGKLTTYRRIAAQVADEVAKTLGHRSRSTTDEIPLVGTGGSRTEIARRLTEVGLPHPTIEPTISRYGSDAEFIARLVESDASLAAPLGDGRTSLADAVYAIRYEAATEIADITLRRTHLAWFTADHARSDVESIAGVMATELGWSPPERADQMRRHETELAVEGL